MPTPPSDAGDPAGWQGDWSDVVEFTFHEASEFTTNQYPRSEHIAGLALAYLCRYLDRAEDHPSTGGGTGGKSAGAAARGRGRASERTLSTFAMALALRFSSSRATSPSVPEHERSWL